MANEVSSFIGPFWDFWGPFFKEPIIEMELRDELDYDALHQQALKKATDGKIIGITRYKHSFSGEIIGFEDICTCGCVLGNIDYFTENPLQNHEGIVEIIYQCPICKKFPHIIH